MRVGSGKIALFAVASILLVTSAALADEPIAPDVPKPAIPPRQVAERPWLYGDDATTPGQWQTIAGTRFTYSSGNTSTTRPFASNLSSPGGIAELNGEVGLLPELSVAATGVMGFGDGVSAGATAGLRFAPLARLALPFRLVLGAGWLHERTSNDGLFVRVAATYDVGPVRFGATFHGEHVFARGRDALDTMLILGANAKLNRFVRLGIEYVAQDLEGYFDDEEAEGGVRHFLGPVASFELWDKRVFLAFGPAVGLSYGSPGLVGRGSLAFAF